MLLDLAHPAVSCTRGPALYAHVIAALEPEQRRDAEALVPVVAVREYRVRMGVAEADALRRRSPAVRYLGCKKVFG